MAKLQKQGKITKKNGFVLSFEKKRLHLAKRQQHIGRLLGGIWQVGGV